MPYVGDPRWGRGSETYGEDVTLTSELAVAFVQGLQGNHSKYKRVVATPKHYTVRTYCNSRAIQFLSVIHVVWPRRTPLKK